MLLLGVLQAQAAGAGPVGAGSFDLLETQVLTGSAASVTFSSLSSYAADYQHLQIRVAALSGQANWANVKINDDSTTGNYRSHALRGFDGTTASNVFSGTATGMQIVMLAGDTTPSPTIIDILDPFSTTKNKTLRFMTGLPNGGGNIALTSGAYFSTNAITTITMTHGSSTFSTGSRFSIYGLKVSA